MRIQQPPDSPALRETAPQPPDMTISAPPPNTAWVRRRALMHGSRWAPTLGAVSLLVMMWHRAPRLPAIPIWHPGAYTAAVVAGVLVAAGVVVRVVSRVLQLVMVLIIVSGVLWVIAHRGL